MLRLLCFTLGRGGTVSHHYGFSSWGAGKRAAYQGRMVVGATEGCDTSAPEPEEEVRPARQPSAGVGVQKNTDPPNVRRAQNFIASSSAGTMQVAQQGNPLPMHLL